MKKWKSSIRIFTFQIYILIIFCILKKKIFCSFSFTYYFFLYFIIRCYDHLIRKKSKERYHRVQFYYSWYEKMGNSKISFKSNPTSKYLKFPPYTYLKRNSSSSKQFRHSSSLKLVFFLLFFFFSNSLLVVKFVHLASYDEGPFVFVNVHTSNFSFSFSLSHTNTRARMYTHTHIHQLVICRFIEHVR